MLTSDLMARMTSEVCLACFTFTEPPCAKDILSWPKPSVNTPIQNTGCIVANTHCVSHTNSHMLLIDVCSAVIVSLSLLFITQLSCPSTQLNCEHVQSTQAHQRIAELCPVQFMALDARWATNPSFSHLG